MKARFGLVVATAVIPSVLGYGAFGAVAADAAGHVARFAFSQTALSKSVPAIPDPTMNPSPSSRANGLTARHQSPSPLLGR